MLWLIGKGCRNDGIMSIPLFLAFQDALRDLPFIR